MRGREAKSLKVSQMICLLRVIIPREIHPAVSRIPGRSRAARGLKSLTGGMR